MELLTVAETAALLKMSPDFVTKRFGRLEGVVDLGTVANIRKHKRQKRCLRIPRAVLDKFINDHKA